MGLDKKISLLKIMEKPLSRKLAAAKQKIIKRENWFP